MITPGKYNIHVYRLNDFSFTFDIDIDGTILNLTGANVYAQIRTHPNEEAPIVDDFTVTVTNGTVTGYPSDITLSLTDTETTALDAGLFYYDVLVVDSSDNDTTYLQGTVTIHDTVTVKV